MVSEVEAFLLSGVPELPVAWNNLIREEDNVRRREPDRIRGGAGSSGGGAQGSGRPATVVNSQVHEEIKRRWDNSPHTKTSEMTRDYQGSGLALNSVPKFQDGKQVCLNWALKGECKDDCPRKGSHRAMGEALSRNVLAYMDECQVARA